ncbi:MAG: T9SS type A sorting domain-containing protein [bacterium]|nr:T9SS type A sorting domain-containing protein [bacterium]
MKKLLIAAINVFLFSIPLVSNATITFERTYGQTGVEDVGNFVQQTTDGGYVIVGHSYSAAKKEISLIKTDSIGDTLWIKKFESPLGSLGPLISGRCVRQTTDNGYIIIGNLFGGDKTGGIIIKTDSMGDTLWIKGYNFAMAYIQQTTDNGYIIAGSDDYGDRTALCKIDSLGMIVWGEFFYNTSLEGGCSGFSVQQLPDKGYVMCGTIYDSIYKKFAFLLRTDSLGDSIWSKTYDGINVGFSEVQLTTDNGYILTGGTNFYVAGKGDVWLVKTDSLGDTLWTKIFGGDSCSDYGYSVQQTTDGGFIIAGTTYSFGAGKCDAYLIKTNSSGDTLWTKTFGGINDDAAYSVQQVSDGGYVIAGYKDYSGTIGEDIYLIKTDSVGNVGIEENNSKAISQKLKLEMSPNPAVSALNIRLSGISKGESVNLRIYDLSGRIVKTFSQSEINSSNIRWNGVNEKGIKVKNGVYFCKLSISDGKTIREKIVLMR